MVKVWFKAKNIKTALKLASKIWKLEGFNDCAVMIETSKKIIAYYGGEKKMGKQTLKKIAKREVLELKPVINSFGNKIKT